MSWLAAAEWMVMIVIGTWGVFMIVAITGALVGQSWKLARHDNALMRLLKFGAIVAALIYFAPLIAEMSRLGIRQ